MNKYPRLISWSYIDGRGFFSSKNEKEQLRKIYIKDPKGEEILERGQLCLLSSTFGTHRDPYFFQTVETGFTSRAQKYGQMKSKIKEKHPELERKYTKGIGSKVYDYGDYIYIELPHLDGYVNPLRNDTEFYSENLVYKEMFDLGFLSRLVEYHPLSLMEHEEIKTYQEEYLPQFIFSLKREFPELYRGLWEQSGRVQEIVKEFTCVGKRATVHTLLPGKVEVQMSWLDKLDFDWDGKVLTRITENYQGDPMIQTLEPGRDFSVKILEDETVTEKTNIIE